MFIYLTNREHKALYIFGIILEKRKMEKKLNTEGFGCFFFTTILS